MLEEPTVRLTSVRRLYEVSARMGAGQGLAETLQAVVDGVVDGLGFGIAVLNLRQPDGTYVLIAVAGPPSAKETLLGAVTAADVFDAEFALADVWGGLRFVPHERLTEGQVIRWVPELPVPTEPEGWHPLDALFAPLHAPDGELLGILQVDLPENQCRPGPVLRELLEIFATQAGLAIDKARLTDQLLAEKARLEASEATFRLVFEGAGNGMVTIGFDPPDLGHVVGVNQAFCRLTGYRSDQLIGSTFRDYLDDQDYDQTRRELDELTQHSAAYRFERRFVRADGNGIWLGGSAAVVGRGRGRPRLLLIQVDDVTARRDTERRLRHDAAHDALTGLPNRRLLRLRFNAALARSKKSGRHGALLYCDLDRFKEINDTYGHDAGDQALRQIAARLVAVVRHGDTVARLGGDEFAVLAEDIEGADLTQFAIRLDEAIAQPLDGITVPITASIGTAFITPEADDLDDSLRHADLAMYREKRGR